MIGYTPANGDYERMCTMRFYVQTQRLTLPLNSDDFEAYNYALTIPRDDIKVLLPGGLRQSSSNWATVIDWAEENHKRLIVTDFVANSAPGWHAHTVDVR
jgi:hypothetical protein